MKQKLVNKKPRINYEEDIKNLRAKNQHKISMFLNNFIEENKLKRANSMMSLRHSKTISSFTTCDDSICIEETKDHNIKINISQLMMDNFDLNPQNKRTKEIIEKSKNMYLNELAKKNDNKEAKDKFAKLQGMQRHQTMNLLVKMTPLYKEEEEIDEFNIKYNNKNQLIFISVDLMLKKIINEDFLDKYLLLVHHFCQQCFCFVTKDILFKKLFNCYKFYKNKKTPLNKIKNLIDFINIIIVEMFEYYDLINYNEMQIGLIKKFYNELISDYIINYKESEEKIENKIENIIHNNINEIIEEIKNYDVNKEHILSHSFTFNRKNLINTNLNLNINDINILIFPKKDEIKKETKNKTDKYQDNKNKMNIDFPKVYLISRTLKRQVIPPPSNKNINNKKPLVKIEETIKEENNEDDSGSSSSSSKNSGITKKSENDAENEEYIDNEEENEADEVENDKMKNDILNILISEAFGEKNMLSLKDESLIQINNILKLFEVQNKDIISPLKIRLAKDNMPIYTEIKNRKKVILFSELNKNNYERFRTQSVYTKKSSPGNIIVKPYFCITDWNTEDIGNKLTQVSKSLLNKIYPRELYRGIYLKKEKEKTSPNVVKCINNFNKLTFFIIEDILSYNTPKSRAKVYEKWVQICDYCKTIKNYNDCIAIYSALNNYIITGLKLTLKEIRYKIKSLFEQISIFCSCEDNYRNIRNEMNLCEKKGEIFIPYLGMLLRDINFIEESSKYINEKGCINLEKTEKINNLLEKYFSYKREDKKMNNKQIPKKLDFFDKLEIISEEELENIANNIEPEFKLEKKDIKRMTIIDVKYFGKNNQKRNSITGNPKNIFSFFN